MSERLRGSNEQKIIRPQSDIVEVGQDVDFVYIMRKDTDFALKPFVAALSTDYHLKRNQVEAVLSEEYEVFLDELYQILIEEFSSKGKFELHLFEDNYLREKVFENCNDLPIVSLDPLTYQNVHSFKVSRGYYMGGVTSFNQIARPGSAPLEKQAKRLAKKLNGQNVCLIEDDIFSGGSLKEGINHLLVEKVKIAKSVSGIQVGDASEILALGIDVVPAIKYVAEGAGIFDKVDLGDPRDFLMGSDGLVIKLPNGNLVRAPYIRPFVSSTARASIPNEESFSAKVLWSNLSFYNSVENKISKPIYLKHTNPYFQKMMKEVYGFDSNTLMTDVIKFCFRHFYKLWEYNKSLGEWQKKQEKHE